MTELHRRPNTAVVASIGVTSACAVFARLGRQGLWADEAFSVSTSLRPFGELASLSLNKETNGVLYAFILKIWAALGTSEVWLRMPSAIAFVATAVLTVFLGARVHSAVAGYIAGAMVVVNGSLLSFGQNVRYYAPVTATSVGFGLAVLYALEGQERRTAPSRSPESHSASPDSATADSLPTDFVSRVGPVSDRPRLMMVSVLGVVLPLLHLVAGTLVLAALVWVSLLWRRLPPIRWLLALAPGAAVTIVVAGLVASRNEGQSINQPLGPAAVADVAYSLTGTGGLVGLIGFALLTMMSLRVAFRDRGLQGVNAWFPWVVVATCLGCVFLGSLATTLMVGRYVLFLIPYLLVMVAAGIAAVVVGVNPADAQVGATRPQLGIFGAQPMPPRQLGGVTLPRSSPVPWDARRIVTIGAGLIAVVVGMSAAAIGGIQWVAGDHADWRPPSQTLLRLSAPRDGVLFANDSMRLFVEYELRRTSGSVNRAPTPVFPAAPWGAYRTGDQQYVTFEVEDLQQALRNHTTVWALVEEELLDEMPSELSRALEVVPPTEIRPFPGTAVLYRFDRRR
jgi:uncharacterized membrane protein